VAVGDLHINSTVGLIRPTTNLDDGGTYNSSKGQRWLWRNWLDFWDEVQAVQKRTGKGTKVWTVFNGDLVDVNGKHQQTQNISQNEADVFKMAIDTLLPALERSDRTFVIRGTAAHVKSSASMEEKIAIDIGAEKVGDQYAPWELLIEVDGVLYFIKHHGRLGRLEWTRGNALNRYAVEIMLSFANQRCPDVALTNHNHWYATSSDEYPVKVISNPAWQLRTEFIHRISGPGIADIGGTYFNNQDGEYKTTVKLYQPERIRAWKAK